VADTWQTFKDFGANPVLILYAVGMSFFSMMLTVAQMMIVKYGSAAQKAMADVLRPIFIWIFFMSVRVYDYETDKYDYEEEFSPLQLGGYAIIIAGVLVYNEIVVLPFWKFDKNTAIAIEKREQAQRYDNSTSLL